MRRTPIPKTNPLAQEDNLQEATRQLNTRRRLLYYIYIYKVQVKTWSKLILFHVYLTCVSRGECEKARLHNLVYLVGAAAAKFQNKKRCSGPK